MDWFVAAGTFVTEPLPSNGHVRHNIFDALEEFVD
jgi:hypothetical protein